MDRSQAINSPPLATTQRQGIATGVIRRAVRDDLPGILAIYNHAVLHTTASYAYEIRTLEEQAVWFAEHLQKQLPVFVADDGGEIVGWSSLSSYGTREGYRRTVENSVYVAAGRQGQGIGRMLMRPLVSSARELGLHAILAAIDADNAVSLRLHAAFGFEQVGRLREVGYKFGRWLDVIFMQLLIES